MCALLSGVAVPSAMASELNFLNQTSAALLLDAADLPLNSLPASSVCKGIFFRNPEGLIAEGLRDCGKKLHACTRDGEEQCLANALFPAAEVSNLQHKVVSGESVAGVNGVVMVRPPDCADSGQTGCASSSTYRAIDPAGFSAEDVRSGVRLAGVDGQLQVPAASQVRLGVSFSPLPEDVGALDPGLVPISCTADGQSGCFVEGAFAAAEVANLADKLVLGSSVAGVAGSVTLPDRSQVLSGTSFGLDGLQIGLVTLPTPGAVKAGTTYGAAGGLTGTFVAEVPPNCVSDGRTTCLTTATFPAADRRNLAEHLLAGTSAAGVDGTVTLPPVHKVLSAYSFGVAGGQTGSFSLPPESAVLVAHGTYGDPTASLTGQLAPDFPAASHVLSGHTVNGTPGTLTLPDERYVLASVGAFGVGGNESTASMQLPVEGVVLASTNYGVGGIGLTGKLTLPAAADVDASFGTYGDTLAPVTASYVAEFPDRSAVLTSDTVNGVAGTLTLPEVGDVQSGVSYGVGGNESVGILKLPVAGAVHTSQTSFGRPGALITPTLADCASDTQVQCVTTASFKAADMSAAAAGNIKRGTSVVGTLGTFPSTSHPIPRFLNQGSSSQTAAEGGVSTDLTQFAIQLSSNASFEFWDSTGVRRTGSGDDELKADHIRKGVALEGLSIVGSYLDDCTSDGQIGCLATSRFKAMDTDPSVIVPWDIRKGKTVGGIAGALTFARNGSDLATFNRTAGSGALAGVDFYDSIDDCNRGPSDCGALPTQHPDGWNLLTDASNWVRDSLSDTDGDGACNGAEHCVYRDLMSGSLWSSAAPSVLNWEGAISFCHNLSYGGYPSGWRLPTAKELQLLVISGFWQIKPALSNGSGHHWSSTTSSSNTPDGWRVSFSDGNTYVQGKTNSNPVICVR